MVEISSLSVTLGGKALLSGVDMKINRGRLNILLGRNGSGKTTLINCLNRTVPYRGKILISGKDLSKLSPGEKARLCAFVPQLLPTPRLKVGELVPMGRTPHIPIGKRPTDGDISAVTAARERMGLGALWHRELSSLSGGELQRAYLAMALAQDTELLILDEPTSHMDIIAAEEFMTLCRKLVDGSGKTLLVTVHDIASAVRFGDDITVVKDGRPVFSGAKEACLEAQILEKTFSLERYTHGDRIFFCPDGGEGGI